MLIEQGAVQPLDKTIALGPADLGGLVFNTLKLQEELVGVSIWTPAELTAVMREDRADFGGV